MTQTILTRKIDPNHPLLQGDLHPTLAAIYAARGITDQNDLHYDLKKLLPYHTLRHIDKAVARIASAIEKDERILFIGDYDADGATSTALGVSALKAMGAKTVNFLVPNRFAYGYGLTPEIVEVASRWNPNLLITVDNGIASVKGVDAANEKGIDVVVTDHHLPGKILPNACAIVNPNQPECTFPSKAIAGVGVMFYVLVALRAHLRETHWFSDTRPMPKLNEWLDLVALGTIADVVPLDHNNRLMVHIGLKRIRAGKGRIGINALIKIANRTLETLNASDLGFSVAPRLNAAGRLDDMALGIECLLSENENDAIEKATWLNDLNKERRAIEKTMKQDATRALQFLVLDKKETLPKGLCLYKPDWHQGVIGIVAGRIKELYYRPVIAFAKGGGDGMLKGSARSIPGIHIRDVLDAIASQHDGLIQKFGGHAMAAGLSLEADNFETFSDAFAKTVAASAGDDIFKATILTDGALTAQTLDLSLAYGIRDGGPWGQHFPEPTFFGEFRIMDQRLVGGAHVKFTLSLMDAPMRLVDAIAFNVDKDHWPNYQLESLKAVYRLGINRYKEVERLQLVLESLTPMA